MKNVVLKVKDYCPFSFNLEEGKKGDVLTLIFYPDSTFISFLNLNEKELTRVKKLAVKGCEKEYNRHHLKTETKECYFPIVAQFRVNEGNEYVEMPGRTEVLSF